VKVEDRRRPTEDITTRTHPQIHPIDSFSSFFLKKKGNPVKVQSLLELVWFSRPGTNHGPVQRLFKGYWLLGHNPNQAQLIGFGATYGPHNSCQMRSKRFCDRSRFLTSLLLSNKRSWVCGSAHAVTPVTTMRSQTSSPEHQSRTGQV